MDERLPSNKKAPFFELLTLNLSNMCKPLAVWMGISEVEVFIAGMGGLAHILPVQAHPGFNA
jgi:hypothetical protein